MQNNNNDAEHFYIAAYESGSERDDLPTWANRSDDVIRFDQITSTVTRRDVEAVPGAFQLLNVLSADECDQFVAISESLGYHIDAPVSLPHSVRHNNNLNWVVTEAIDRQIWARCALLTDAGMNGEQALGLNARFRFYRYGPGDYFKAHTDGAWPGSRVVGGELVHDAYGDRFSQMTCLVFLSDGYSGGRTRFYVPREDGIEPHVLISVSTPKGAVLVFPHGRHPKHCLHSGETVGSGTKYIIRTDVLYPF